METTLIAAGGVALAVWLWDGPMPGQPITAADQNPAQRTLMNLLESGCLTSDDLYALRNGQPLDAPCPPAGIRIR